MKQRFFSTKFWSDNWVVNDLNPLDRYLFLYLLLNERSNLIGVYELPLRVAAFESGIDQTDLSRMLVSLSPKVEYIQDSYIYIEKAAEHQATNPNILKGMVKELAALPAAVREDVRAYGIKSMRLAQVFDELDDIQARAELSAEESTNPQKTDQKQVTTKPLQATSSHSKPLQALSSPIQAHPKGSGKKRREEKNKEEKNIYSSPADKPLDAVKQERKEIVEIFDFYVKSFNAQSSHIKLSDKRRQKIKSRLRDAGKEMLFKAIHNTASDSFYRGDNDRGWKANIDFIIRSYEQVEKLANMADPESAGPTTEVDIQKSVQDALGGTDA